MDRIVKRAAFEKAAPHSLLSQPPENGIFSCKAGKANPCFRSS